MKTLKYTSLIWLALITILFSGCQTVRINGQFVDDNDLKAIEGKRLSKDQVTELIGSPTIIPDYSPNNWYYVQRTVSTKAWFEPKILEQKITEVIFDYKGLVQEVRVFNNMNLEHIMVVTEYTKTHGTEMNGIQKFIKNIGRFNKPKKQNKNS